MPSSVKIGDTRPSLYAGSYFAGVGPTTEMQHWALLLDRSIRMVRELESVFDLYMFMVFMVFIVFMVFTSQCFCREGGAKALFWGRSTLSGFSLFAGGLGT